MRIAITDFHEPNSYLLVRYLGIYQESNRGSCVKTSIIEYARIYVGRARWMNRLGIVAVTDD
jgi:hypothetical protein